MIVSDSLLKELANGKETLEKKLQGRFISFTGLFKRSLKDEANLHSCELERECIAVDGDLRKQCMDNLKNAWDWGIKTYSPDFTEQFIIELAKRIKPCEIKSYRENGVTVSGASTTPPYPAKLKSEMRKFMGNLDYGRKLLEEKAISPVELAILAHFHLVRVHPFEDGNGRTSRLLQNLTLNHYRFPIAIIYKGEKQDYIHHLDEAVKNYKLRSQDNGSFWQNISDAERNLYNYLTTKVLVSFDLINSGKYKI